ncbi:hypothetical protein [uncultured Desulfuromusa sp.]|uniref:hypothetical protein n=1 Tax=uncultured Desulfuromusa sp. TaxID=219183 RepID=UPI002AA95924|nr:hypothetical protein [uncultured Desulfuromusa sp.]
MIRSKPYWRHRRPEKPPEPQPQPDLLQKFLLNPTFIIAFFTAMLYFHGQALYSGYLSYWGLSANLLPLSFEETLTHGAYSYLCLSLDHWEYLVGMGLSLVLMYVLVFLLLFKKPASFIYRACQTKRINNAQKALAGEAADRFLMLNVVILIILTILLIMLLAHSKGKSYAEAEHQKIKSATPATAKIVTINYLDEKSQPAVVSGTLLQSSSLMLAIYTENNEIMMIPVARVVSVHRRFSHPSSSDRATNS